jgi:hypothetical protein
MLQSRKSSKLTLKLDKFHDLFLWNALTLEDISVTFEFFNLAVSLEVIFECLAKVDSIVLLQHLKIKFFEEKNCSTRCENHGKKDLR